jgi:hypothetical protein
MAEPDLRAAAFPKLTEYQIARLARCTRRPCSTIATKRVGTAAAAPTATEALPTGVA